MAVRRYKIWKTILESIFSYHKDAAVNQTVLDEVLNFFLLRLSNVVTRKSDEFPGTPSAVLSFTRTLLFPYTRIS